WWLRSKPRLSLTTFGCCKAVAFRPITPSRTRHYLTSCAHTFPARNLLLPPISSHCHRLFSPCSLNSATCFLTNLLFPVSTYSIPSRRSVAALRFWPTT